MPTFRVGDDQDPLEEGQYPARIISIEPVTIDPNNPPRFDHAQSAITWELTEVERDDGSPITRRQYVNDVKSLTPKSGWYGIFAQVLNGGQPLEKDKEYSTDDLLQKEAVIFWGSYVGEDGTHKMKILNVSPAKKQAVAAGVRRKITNDEIDAI